MSAEPFLYDEEGAKLREANNPIWTQASANIGWAGAQLPAE